MKYYKCLPAFFLFLNVFLLNGCTFFSERETAVFTIKLEEFTEGGWKAVYFDCEGKEETELFEKNCILIEVNKNFPLPVLIYNAEDTENLSNPYGAIYPYSTEISSENGFAAKILFMLLKGSYEDFDSTQEFLSHFNWPRFMEECRKSENPWNFDGEKIAKKIASGSFRKTDLK